MKLTVLGSDGSWAGPGGAGSGYLLQRDGFNAIFDLGGGTLGRLQDHIAIAEINAIFISHVRPDHFADLYQLSIACHYRGQGPGSYRCFPRLPVRVGDDVFAYTGDGGPSDAIVSLAAAADILLSEATWLAGRGLPFHLTARQAGEHAARAGASKLCLRTSSLASTRRCRSYRRARPSTVR